MATSSAISPAALAGAVPSRAGDRRSRRVAVALGVFALGNAVGIVVVLGVGRRRRPRLPLAQLRRCADRPRAADGAPRRLPGAGRGAAARPAAVPRARRRLRPAHGLAPPQRVRGDRARARARRLLGLGLRPPGRQLVPGRVLELADAAPAWFRDVRRRRLRRPLPTRGSSPPRSAPRSCSRSSSPRSSSSAAGSRTSGGTPCTSRSTRRSRSRGST